MSRKPKFKKLRSEQKPSAKAVIAYILALFSSTAFAFEAGEPVFAKLRPDNWIAAKFVKTSNHCFVTENSKSVSQLWSELPDTYGGKVEKGGEIFFKFGKVKNEPKYRVLSVDQTCHVVKTDRDQTVRPSEILSAREFRKLVGSRTEFVVGDKVYIQQFSETEQWTLSTVTGIGDGCLETDGPTVLYADGTEVLYSLPPVAKSVKVGDKILANLSFRPDGLLPVTVKGRKGDHLTVSVPFADSEGEFEEQVKLPKVTYVSSPHSKIEFSKVKPGAEIMVYSKPPSCDSAFYRPIKIVGLARRCYLVNQYGDLFAQVARQLVPAGALPK